MKTSNDALIQKINAVKIPWGGEGATRLHECAALLCTMSAPLRNKFNEWMNAVTHIEGQLALFHEFSLHNSYDTSLHIHAKIDELHDQILQIVTCFSGEKHEDQQIVIGPPLMSSKWSKELQFVSYPGYDGPRPLSEIEIQTHSVSGSPVLLAPSGLNVSPDNEDNCYGNVTAYVSGKSSPRRFQISYPKYGTELQIKVSLEELCKLNPHLHIFSAPDVMGGLFSKRGFLPAISKFLFLQKHTYNGPDPDAIIELQSFPIAASEKMDQ